jgi:DNA-binding NarL/FixJ family response regulator
VVLIDDHTVIRQGTRLVLQQTDDITVVAEAGTAEEGVELCQHHQPDVVVLDIRLRGASGIDVARQIRSVSPVSRILVLTAYDYEQYVRAAVDAGASGYLLKDSSAAELIHAVRVVKGGGSILNPRVTSRVLTRLADGPTPKLTDRERDVLSQLALGKTNSEIGVALGIAARTVEAHVSGIMDKLQATTRTEAVARAVKLGLIEID